MNRSRRPSPIFSHESNTSHFQHARDISINSIHRISPVDKDQNKGDEEDEDEDEDEDEENEENEEDESDEDEE